METEIRRSDALDIIVHEIEDGKMKTLQRLSALSSMADLPEEVRSAVVELTSQQGNLNYEKIRLLTLEILAVCGVQSSVIPTFA